MRKWIKDNNWNILSNFIAIVSLIVSIWLACTANNIANKANEMTNRVSVLKLENFELSLKAPERVKSKVRVDSEQLSGATINLSGKILIEYGELSRLYFVKRDVITNNLQIEEIKINNRKEIDLQHFTSLESKGRLELINEHFYLIAVDESHTIHRILFEATAKSEYTSTPNPGGKTGNLEYNSKNAKDADIYYRYFNDYELVQYPSLQTLANWNYLKHNESNRENKDYIPLSPTEISRDIEEINQLFATYGFK